MKTRMYSLPLLLIILTALNALGCTRSESKTLSDPGIFTSIELKTVADVFITQGDVPNIRMEGDAKEIEKLDVENKKGSLIISSDEDINSKSGIKIFITVKELNDVELSGSGNISMMNQWKNTDLSLRLTGSGNITGDVDSKSLTVLISGSGNVSMKGRTGSSDITISGSGNLEGKDLKSISSTIKISGSGTTTVDVVDELVVDITGSGNVFYISDPERIQAKSRGVGRIEKLKA